MPDLFQPRWKNITSVQVISVLLGTGGGREGQIERGREEGRGREREWHRERD